MEVSSSIKSCFKWKEFPIKNLNQAVIPKNGRLRGLFCFVEKRRWSCGCKCTEEQHSLDWREKNRCRHKCAPMREVFLIPSEIRLHASGGQDGGRWYKEKDLR